MKSIMKIQVKGKDEKKHQNLFHQNSYKCVMEDSDDPFAMIAFVSLQSVSQILLAHYTSLYSSTQYFLIFLFTENHWLYDTEIEQSNSW